MVLPPSLARCRRNALPLTLRAASASDGGAGGAGERRRGGRRRRRPPPPPPPTRRRGARRKRRAAAASRAPNAGRRNASGPRAASCACSIASGRTDASTRAAAAAGALPLAERRAALKLHNPGAAENGGAPRTARELVGARAVRRRVGGAGGDRAASPPRSPRGCGGSSGWRASPSNSSFAASAPSSSPARERLPPSPAATIAGSPAGGSPARARPAAVRETSAPSGRVVVERRRCVAPGSRKHRHVAWASAEGRRHRCHVAARHAVAARAPRRLEQLAAGTPRTRRRFDPRARPPRRPAAPAARARHAEGGVDGGSARARACPSATEAPRARSVLTPKRGAVAPPSWRRRRARRRPPRRRRRHLFDLARVGEHRRRGAPRAAARSLTGRRRHGAARSGSSSPRWRWSRRGERTAARNAAGDGRELSTRRARAAADRQGESGGAATTLSGHSTPRGRRRRRRRPLAWRHFAAPSVRSRDDAVSQRAVVGASERPRTRLHRAIAARHRGGRRRSARSAGSCRLERRDGWPACAPARAHLAQDDLGQRGPPSQRRAGALPSRARCAASVARRAAPSRAKQPRRDASAAAPRARFAARWARDGARAARRPSAAASRSALPRRHHHLRERSHLVAPADAAPLPPRRGPNAALDGRRPRGAGRPRTSARGLYRCRSTGACSRLEHDVGGARRRRASTDAAVAEGSHEFGLVARAARPARRARARTSAAASPARR